MAEYRKPPSGSVSASARPTALGVLDLTLSDGEEAGSSRAVQRAELTSRMSRSPARPAKSSRTDSASVAASCRATTEDDDGFELPALQSSFVGGREQRSEPESALRRLPSVTSAADKPSKRPRIKQTNKRKAPHKDTHVPENIDDFFSTIDNNPDVAVHGAEPDPDADVDDKAVPAKAAIRRTGASAAVKRTATARSAKWVKVADMAERLGLTHITAIDPGRRNMGIFRIDLRTLKVTHWLLIDLDELCKEYEQGHPGESFDTGEKRIYSHDDRFFALFHWASAQCKDGGCLDSDFTFVERQEFSREMSSIQSILQCAVIASKKPVPVYSFDEDSPERAANRVSACPQIGADSVKTCYEPLFPRVEETTAGSRRKGAFGMGNANRRDGDNQSKQYAENKRNSKLYGRKIISPAEIIEMMGDRMSVAQRARFKKAKLDDIYDAMWIALAAIETWIPCMYNRRVKCVGAAITLHGSMPQRRRRTYDALLEFLGAMGTSALATEELRSVLFSPKFD